MEATLRALKREFRQYAWKSSIIGRSSYKSMAKKVEILYVNAPELLLQVVREPDFQFVFLSRCRSAIDNFLNGHLDEVRKEIVRVVLFESKSFAVTIGCAFNKKRADILDQLIAAKGSTSKCLIQVIRTVFFYGYGFPNELFKYFLENYGSQLKYEHLLVAIEESKYRWFYEGKDSFNLLLDHISRAELNPSEPVQQGVLFHIIERFDVDLFERLISLGCDPSLEKSLIFMCGASCIFHNRVSRVLVAHGMDLNERDEHGYTRLHYLAFGKAAKHVQTMVDYGANCCIPDPYGRVPLVLWYLKKLASYIPDEHGVSMIPDTLRISEETRVRFDEATSELVVEGLLPFPIDPMRPFRMIGRLKARAGETRISTVDAPIELFEGTHPIFVELAAEHDPRPAVRDLVNIIETRRRLVLG